MFLSKIVIFVTLILRIGGSTPNVTSCWDNFCQFTYPNDTTPESPNDMQDDVFEYQRCFCDKDCVKFNDCCNDAQLPRTHTNMFLETSCHRITEDSHSVYVVKTCPSNWQNSKIRSFCERKVKTSEYQPILDIPFYSLTTMNLYLNIYCAKCNNDHLHSTMLKMNVMCASMKECRQDFRKNSSYIPSQLKWLLPNRVVMTADIVDPEFNRFRKCHRVVNKCANSWTDFSIRQLCNNGSSLYVLDRRGRRYKNIYCAQCNYEVVMKLQCGHTRFFQESEYPQVLTDGNEIQFNWILDFSFSPNEECLDADEIYYNFMDTCLSLSCGENYELVGGKCFLKVVTEVQNTTSNFSLYSCVKVQIPITEFLSFPNGSIYWNRTRTLYSEEEVEVIENSSYIVCIDKDEMPGRQIFGVRQFGIAQSLLSKICMSISLVCLATHVVIQYLTGQHRKLPGKCLLNLSIALFSGHLVFIVGVNRTEKERFCFIVGVITHFFLLTVFFWMNVMAIDIYRTFTRSFQRSSWKTNTFPCYCIYAWFIPLIIVTASTSIDCLHATSKFRPRYGNGVCWISDRYALFIFFALPVAIILIENIILFLITAYTIHKTTKIKENLQISSERKRFRVYIKLAFIVGLPWIVGFAAAFTDFEPLWYARIYNS